MFRKVKNVLRLLKNVVSIRCGRPYPIIAVWDTTYRCNMRCCFCNEKNLISKEMDTSAALNMIAQLAKLKTSVLLLTGGEPTLRRDIDIIMTQIKNSGMSSIFTTNGSTIRQNLKSLVKADMVRLSVDGYGHVHDTIRGAPGAFKKISEGVPLLVDAGKPPMLICVVTTKVDRDNLRKLFDQARTWGVQVDLSMVTYSRRTDISSKDKENFSQNQKENRIRKEDFLLLLDEFEKDYSDVIANPKFYRKIIENGGLGKACRAMDVALSIKPDGRVAVPCDAFTLRMLEGSMQDIWGQIQTMNDIKNKLGEYGFCSYCYKRCIAFPSMLLNFKNLVDLISSYLPSIKHKNG